MELTGSVSHPAVNNAKLVLILSAPQIYLQKVTCVLLLSFLTFLSSSNFETVSEINMLLL